jgi:hypothetical protein
MGLANFLDNLSKQITAIKTPAVFLIIFITVMIAGYNAFIGGQDKRSLVSTILALMAFALFVFFLDDIVNGLSNFAK